MQNKFNRVEIDAISDAIAGKLVADGITTSNFDKHRCKEILSNCVLANKLLPFFDEHHLRIYDKIFLYQESQSIEEATAIANGLYGNESNVTAFINGFIYAKRNEKKSIMGRQS